MPLYPSQNILAKDAIGYAEELAGVEEARLSIKSIGRTFYNMAIAEIQTLLGYIDMESLMNSAAIDVTTPTGKYKAAPLYTSSTEEDFISYDKIINLELTNGASTTLINIQTFPLPIKEFLKHKSNMASGAYTGAIHPYEESAIYTLVGSTLHLLWGSSFTIATPVCNLYYVRQPVILTSSNYDSAKIDIPDKYMSLLVNRIAAYAEMRQGITDKSMAVVQQSYNNLLAPLESQQKAKILDSFQFKSNYTPNEQQNPFSR